MKIIECVQGDSVWHSHRKPPMRNASDTPSVMGHGYESRSDFMRRWVTGIEREYDEVTQDRFAEGHRFEKLALPLMEEIVGESLYPVVGVNGKYSASFDGLTAADDIAAEHKSLNDEIRACQCAADLAPKYKIQMEVQLFVSGASKCLFMATNWDANDNLLEEKHFWYEPDLKLRASIDSSWDQFEEDARDHKPVEVIPVAKAAPTIALPALSIQVAGSITLHDNLKLFGEGLQAFIAKLPEKPSTDQEFADCKAACKTLQKAQDELDAAEAHALGQIASFDEMKRTKAFLFDLARTTRLAVEKMVTAREQTIKVEIVQEGRDALAKHIAGLLKRLGKPYAIAPAADFAAAAKGKRSIATLRDACDTELAKAKIEANAMADRISINLLTLEDFGAGYDFLFADIISLALKDCDDFAALVKVRVSDHKAAEAKLREVEAALHEGCAPADIAVLRQANIDLAQESHIRATLLQEWLDTELDSQDEEYQPWLDDFTARVMAALPQVTLAPERTESAAEQKGIVVTESSVKRAPDISAPAAVQWPRIDSDLDAGWLPFPSKLHPATRELVLKFAFHLAIKLRKAEQKYGYSDGWKSPDWMDECRAKLREHVEKGDPLDVAAYCAFLHWHRESTAAEISRLNGEGSKS